jgi:signal peptide peptidase-like protein 2B
MDKSDYDCDNGQAYIPSNEFSTKLNFITSPGGYDTHNDEYLTGKSENNMCVKYGVESNTFFTGCESERCLVTGKNVTDSSSSSSNGGIKYEACCAWDFAIWLYEDTTLTQEQAREVTLPAVYITMQQATELLDLINGVNSNNNNNNGVNNIDPIVLSIYERERPSVNSSAIIIWALGVFVAWMASYHSSMDYRNYTNAIMIKNRLVSRAGGGRREVGGDNELPTPERRDGTPRSRSQSRERNNSDNTAATVSSSSPPLPSERGERTIYVGGDSDSVTAIIANHRPHQHEDESLELDASHALGFIVMASTSLLVLFFFKIFKVVKIMYAFGCSGAFAQIVLHPLLKRIFRKLRWTSPMRPMECLSEENATRAALNGGCKGKILMCLHSFFGPITCLDVMASIIAYGVGGTWLYIAFTVPHPDTILFYWVVQDVFGACMCILFLDTIKINAIRVAAILLIVAFFYDIFFVFVTPLLTKHGESIMVNVATSGGPPKADPSWCEKYPASADCKGGDPLPMLFAIPRIGDYQGGSSMLGLGDIVLPGLLLSFASRFDEAKRLMGLVSGGSGRVRNGAGGVPGKTSWNICCGCGRGGYFGPVVVAYAIGLAMANAAVYIMQMGQPALLYLVPCCLGTFVFMARRNGELDDIWDNPRAIRAADALVFGGRIESEDGEDEGVTRTSCLLLSEEAEMT